MNPVVTARFEQVHYRLPGGLRWANIAQVVPADEIEQHLALGLGTGQIFLQRAGGGEYGEGIGGHVSRRLFVSIAAVVLAQPAREAQGLAPGAFVLPFAGFVRPHQLPGDVRFVGEDEHSPVAPALSFTAIQRLEFRGHEVAPKVLAQALDPEIGVAEGDLQLTVQDGFDRGIGGTHQTRDLTIELGGMGGGVAIDGDSPKAIVPGSATVLNKGEMESGGRLIPSDMQHYVGMGGVRFNLERAAGVRLGVFGHLGAGHFNKDGGHADGIAVLEEVEGDVCVSDLARAQVKDDGRAVMGRHDIDLLAGRVEDIKEGSFNANLYRQMFAQDHFLYRGAEGGTLDGEADNDRDARTVHPDAARADDVGVAGDGGMADGFGGGRIQMMMLSR